MYHRLKIVMVCALVSLFPLVGLAVDQLAFLTAPSPFDEQNFSAGDIAEVDGYIYISAGAGALAMPGGSNKVVYVFMYDCKSGIWDTATIRPPEWAEDVYSFGITKLSANASRLIIGAPNKDGDPPPMASPKAFILERKGLPGTNEWEYFEQVLEGDEWGGFGLEYTRFGAAVDIEGDTAIVGASYEPYDTNPYSLWHRRGAAYIFEYNHGTGNWDKTRLSPSELHPRDNFGYSVSVKGDYIAVGTRRGEGCEQDTGTAYIYKRNIMGGWNAPVKVWASDGEGPNGRPQGDWFGWRVSLDKDGTRLLVGAKRDYIAPYGDQTGSAYVFARDPAGAWHGGSADEEAKLIAGDPDGGDLFGSGVSLSHNGKTALIGAMCYDIYMLGYGADAGAAYVFRYDEATSTWSEDVKLTPWRLNPDVPILAGAFFGKGVALSGSGNYALVKAPHRDVLFNGNVKTRAGAAYLFGLND